MGRLRLGLSSMVHGSLKLLFMRLFTTLKVQRLVERSGIQSFIKPEFRENENKHAALNNKRNPLTNNVKFCLSSQLVRPQGQCQIVGMVILNYMKSSTFETHAINSHYVSFQNGSKVLTLAPVEKSDGSFVFFFTSNSFKKHRIATKLSVPSC